MSAAAPARSLTPAATKRSRRKVDHYYGLASMNIADEMGVQCRALCGVWSRGPMGSLGPHNSRNSGIKPSDCKRCLRILVSRGLELVEGTER